MAVSTKVAFWTKSKLYLHIGWSLGPLATDTFLLRWSSSSTAYFYYTDATFLLKMFETNASRPFRTSSRGPGFSSN